MKILFLLFIFVAIPAFAVEEKPQQIGSSGKEESDSEERQGQAEPSQVQPETKDLSKPMPEKQVIPMSLPKYTITQIKEMKAKGIDPEKLEQASKIEETTQQRDSETDEAKINEKPVYRTPESACAHLRVGQICEYRKRNNSRWIGNCVHRPNKAELYCK